MQSWTKKYDTNFRFHRKKSTTEKVAFLFFNNFFAIIDKIYILEGRLFDRL